MANEKIFSTRIEESASRIKKSSAIACILPDCADVAVLGAAGALALALRGLGKSVSMFGPAYMPPRMPAVAKLIAESNKPIRDFIISLDVTRSPVRELKYERDQSRLNIILSPIGPGISREQMEFRPGPLRYDLVITIGVASLDAAARSIASVPELPYEKPVLNIDVDPKNSRYGEINLVPEIEEGTTRLTIPEIVYELLQTTHADVENRGLATLLLAAITAATNKFRLRSATAELFSMASKLAKHADRTEASSMLIGSSSFAETKLAARAIARSRFDEAAGILWAMLTTDDFLKTGCGSDSLGEVMESLKDAFPEAGHYVLLWQSPNESSIRSIIENSAEGAPRVLTSGASSGVLTAGEAYPSFIAAEHAIAQLLRETNAVK